MYPRLPFLSGGDDLPSDQRAQCGDAERIRAYNPEPLAEFFDIFYIGEGETVYDELLDTYKEWKKSGASRKEFLRQAARIEGLYVPQFYDVTYNEDGTIGSFVPNDPAAPAKVRKQVVMDVTDASYPMKPES